MKELLQYPTVHEALLYEKLKNDKVRCNLCERRCLISPSLKGFCKTRVNIDGRLYTLVYGDISIIESRPIEIKPFFHYWPGSMALTFSTWSCNLDCVWCQNYHLSKKAPNPIESIFYPPRKIVEGALQGSNNGLCASFQEPTLLTEWVISVFKMAQKKDLYCCYVSNGYMTEEALKLLRNAGLDGLKIDVKGNTETYQKFCGNVDVEKIWRNVREAKKLGIHVEVVNLVVTGVNDDEASLRWVIERHLKDAGSDTPLHFTRYYPAYNFCNPPTKVETLEEAYNMAKTAGVFYPYLGNVRGHCYENTYCPNCGEELIQRIGYRIIDYKVASDKRCPMCHHPIPIKGKYINT